MTLNTTETECNASTRGSPWSMNDIVTVSSICSICNELLTELNLDLRRVGFKYGRDLLALVVTSNTVPKQVSVFYMNAEPVDRSEIGVVRLNSVSIVFITLKSRPINQDVTTSLFIACFIAGFNWCFMHLTQRRLYRTRLLRYRRSEYMGMEDAWSITEMKWALNSAKDFPVTFLNFTFRFLISAAKLPPFLCTMNGNLHWKLNFTSIVGCDSAVPYNLY